jgi:nucleoside-triphosphatase
VAPKILLEGRPAVGKTTVARRVADLLVEAGDSLAGFTTEELREGRRRVGFAVETFEGERATLAHVDFPGPPRVSKYGVDLEAFERLALPALKKIGSGDVVLIDELGKMELASEAFCDAVLDLFERAVAIVATVQIARHPFTDALKSRAGVETVRVTTSNRNELPAQVAARMAKRR